MILCFSLMNKCRAHSLSYFFALCVAFILAFQFLALRIPSHALMPSILFEFVQPLLKLRFLSRALFANRLFLFRYATTLFSPPPPPPLPSARHRNSSSLVSGDDKDKKRKDSNKATPLNGCGWAGFRGFRCVGAMWSEKHADDDFTETNTETNSGAHPLLSTSYLSLSSGGMPSSCSCPSTHLYLASFAMFVFASPE